MCSNVVAERSCEPCYNLQHILSTCRGSDPGFVFASAGLGRSMVGPSVIFNLSLPSVTRQTRGGGWRGVSESSYRARIQRKVELERHGKCRGIAHHVSDSESSRPQSDYKVVGWVSSLLSCLTNIAAVAIITRDRTIMPASASTSHSSSISPLARNQGDPTRCGVRPEWLCYLAPGG